MRRTILCPIDFSGPSRGALRYALAIATEFDGDVLLMTVNDPLLTNAADLRMGAGWYAAEARLQLQGLLAEFTISGATPKHVEIVVTTGKAAPDIVRVAAERRCDLIVMSTHGLTGPRKWLLGATTERVLRSTTVPVLVTPPAPEGPATFAELVKDVKRVLVPVDMSEATADQVDVASRIAATLKLPLLIAHVVEPLRVALPEALAMPDVEAEQFARANTTIARLVRAVPPTVPTTTAVDLGDAAEGIVKAARDGGAGLIVMALHGSPMFGPRMGSVTYRTLCLAGMLTLALPPVVREPAKPV